MLELHGIVKKYLSGDNEVKALNGIDLKFRKNEFVSILGPSGCGKTTMLNIIGGLDRYTSGDLIINGISTKEYRDRDWDSYRNHSVGFVFQSYNLIPHQTVLANVELALTLSGVSKSERRQRAKDALIKVGLGDQFNKKPSQMSGGQMQRVAIARALVNNPDILLADEPTGALDTSTSVQIMDLLKEVAKDRLVIMVTHNPELAEQYSTRIVRLSDGEVVNDTDPYDGDTVDVKEPKKKVKTKKTSMSFFTAISLSMKNLLTKKGRTVMTSFAGSIGIIGIALILSVSQGVTGFINDVQKDTLSSFPISIYAEEADLSAMMSALMSSTENIEDPEHEMDAVYANPILANLIKGLTSADVKKNNLKPFKEWLEDSANTEISEHVSGIHYTYDISLNMYVKDPNGEYTKADIAELFADLSGGMQSSSSMMSMGSSFSSYDVWCEMLPGEKDPETGEKPLISDMIYDQYDLVAGEWPTAENEIVLVLSSTNEISDLVLYTLGYKTQAEMTEIIMSAFKPEAGSNTEKEEFVPEDVTRIEYTDIVGKTYKLILNSDYYNYNEATGLYDKATDEIMELRIGKGYDVKISGIIKPNADASSTVLTGNLAYTSALTDYVIRETLKTDLAKAQLNEANANFDVFTGLPFVKEEKELTKEQKLQALDEYLASATAEEKAELYFAITATPSDEYVSESLEKMKKDFGLNELESDALRDKLADMLTQRPELGGLDKDGILSLIEGYTDKELEKMLDDYLIESIVTTYRDSKIEAIRDAATAPSAAVIAQIKTMIEAKILQEAGVAQMNHSTRLGVVAKTYAENTGLPITSVITALYAETEEQIATRYDAIVTEMATEFYNSNYTPTEEDITGNIAAMLDEYMASADEATKLEIYESHMPDGLSDNTYADNLKLIGVCDLSSPSAIHIYASTFESKDEIADLIAGYNEGKLEDDQITYTDYVAILMSGITTIINAISYVLIAFVAISLIVSSVMIGIITNISVLERTKEIGILRAIGASKKDISRVFNAETFIIGLAAGIIGIVSTVILCFPINAIIQYFTGLTNLTAQLPALAGAILVLISMVLTMIAGLIPARNASTKDPVEALRSE